MSRTYQSTSDHESELQREVQRAELGMRVLDLPCFVSGVRLAKAVWEWVATLAPGYEGVIDQITRSACSVPANISEGIGRATPGQQLQFARYAYGSCLETFAHLVTSPVVPPPELLQTCKDTAREVQGWCLELARLRV